MFFVALHAENVPHFNLVQKIMSLAVVVPIHSVVVGQLGYPNQKSSEGITPASFGLSTFVPGGALRAVGK